MVNISTIDNVLYIFEESINTRVRRVPMVNTNLFVLLMNEYNTFEHMRAYNKYYYCIQSYYEITLDLLHGVLSQVTSPFAPQ